MDKMLKKVLSIQSHVVSGYVGNKSATFPLQVLGYEVDAINSVQFSNHTGYGTWKGQVLTQEQLTEITAGLVHNGLDKYSHLLTGYVGDEGFLRQIVQVVKGLRQENPNLVFVCDPVMGDNGLMYVPKELLPIYRNEIIPLANVLTPNQFELELLSERSISTISDALDAIESIHRLGVNTVVLSSTDLGSESHLLALASSVTNNNKRSVFKIDIPKFPASFTGTGDLFAALFLAWFDRSESLQTTLENTIATMQSVLKRTYAHARKVSDGDQLTVASLELKLIQSKQDIENPTPTIVAEPIDI